MLAVEMVIWFLMGVCCEVDPQQCFSSSDLPIYAIVIVYSVMEKNLLQFLQVSEMLHQITKFPGAISHI